MSTRGPATASEILHSAGSSLLARLPAPGRYGGRRRWAHALMAAAVRATLAVLGAALVTWFLLPIHRRRTG